MELSNKKIKGVNLYIPPSDGYKMTPHKYPHVLPSDAPIGACLVGSMGNGKTCIAMNICRMIMNPHMRAIIVSPSLTDDSTSRAFLKLLDTNNVPYYAEEKLIKAGGENVIEHIIETLKGKKGEKLEAGDPPDEFFIFLDDNCGDMRRERDSISTLIRRYRHFNCHVCIAQHRWLDLTPNARRHLNTICVFAGSDVNDLKRLYSECNLTNMTFDEFLHVYNVATAEPYCFLYIKRNKTGVELRKNFDQPFVHKKSSDDSNDTPNSDSETKQSSDEISTKVQTAPPVKKSRKRRKRRAFDSSLDL